VVRQNSCDFFGAHVVTSRSDVKARASFLPSDVIDWKGSQASWHFGTTAFAEALSQNAPCFHRGHPLLLNRSFPD
jgi:hypothetical protein